MDDSKQDRLKKITGLRPGKLGMGGKVALIIVMVFLFLIPLEMIKSLVHEREGRKQEAEWDISSSWGGETVIGGPVLVVPRIIEKEILDEEGKRLRVVRNTHYAYLLPETLVLDVQSRKEIKTRGIFDVPVFTHKIRGSGSFALSKLQDAYPEGELLWEKAHVQFSYPDLKGMQKVSALEWNGTDYDFKAGTSSFSFFGGALSVPLTLKAPAEEGEPSSFAFSQEIRGDRSLSFLPLGGETKVRLASDWPFPSFGGYVLPGEKELRDDGFTASWTVNALSRSVPDCWMDWEEGAFDGMRQSGFGLDFYPEFDSYRKTRRTVDYGILFLILPFLTFFLFEALGGVRIHPVQYLLAGLGDVLFYLVLLSLSEHIAFVPSYFLAAGAVMILLCSYAFTIRNIGRKAWSLLPVLASGYGYLFFVLKSEDYALLMGTAGLFAALALTMYLTRKISWYGE